MKKKSLMVMATLLALAFSASLSMAMAANDPSGLREAQSAPPVVAPAQDIQPAPAMGTPPQNYPSAQIGPHYHDGRYYSGWGCGYYHRGANGGNYYGGWGCGWGCW